MAMSWGRAVAQADLKTDYEEKQMPDSKPNILVIWGDDIGITT
jgi:hypothetical protein